MSEESEIQKHATPTNNNTISLLNDSDSTWNYIWDDKLCKTTLKLLKTTVYTPPLLPLPDPELPLVCPVEGCNKSFSKCYRSQLRVHLKRHLPDNEKPFKCDQPECTKAFIRYEDFKVHKRTHTGEKPFECEQCGKKFNRHHHLSKHLKTHIKKTNMNIDHSPDVSSEDFGNDNSEDAIDIDTDDSSTGSLLDEPVKEEIDTEPDTTVTDEDHCHEMEKIKVEPKKINEPLLSDFCSSNLFFDIKETKIQETGGGNGYAANETSSSSLDPKKLEVPVKQKISTSTKTNEFDDPIKLNMAVKQEIKTETTFQYDKQFEEFVLKELKDEDEDEMVAQPLTEPTSMSAAIHPLTNPIQISENSTKLESNDYSTKLEVLVKQKSDTESSDEYDPRFEEFVMKELKEEPDIIAQPDYPDLYSSYEPSSMSAAIHRLSFPMPIAASIIKSESKLKNNSQSKSKPTNNIESESKVTEKRYKCSVEGCDRAFSVPYGLKRHSWVHTKVKTFECKQCEKKFLRRDHLSKHMKTHSLYK